MQAQKSPGVITQNIDNLHQASGIAPEDVVELHGNTTYATCLQCAARYEVAWVRSRFEASGGCAPDCACGRPDAMSAKMSWMFPLIRSA